MSWQYERFFWASDEQTLGIEVRLFEPGERCEPRIDVIGHDDPEADTMFVLKTADGDIKETWRPEPMQVVALEAVVEQQYYVVKIKHRQEWTKMKAELGEGEAFELYVKKNHLAEADTGYV